MHKTIYKFSESSDNDDTHNEIDYSHCIQVRYVVRGKVMFSLVRGRSGSSVTLLNPPSEVGD